MAKIFSTVVRRVIVQGGGGEIPPGAAVMSDSVSLKATLFLSDINDTPTDSAFFEITLFQSETNAAQSEALTVAISNQDAAEIIASQSDELLLSVQATEEPIAEQTDAMTVAISGDALTDLVAQMQEALTLGLSGTAFEDSNDAPTDTRASTLTRWATTNTTAGTAPTNPTNAQGQNNGTVAQVKAGGLANGTSTLTLNIVQPLTGAGANPLFLAYYSNTTGVGDTFTQNVSYRQIGQGTNTVIALTQGNFLTTPFQTTLTNIDTAQNVVVTFTHAATVPATGGNTQVDAVGIQSTGVL